jgi:hypothetical protein
MTLRPRAPVLGFRPGSNFVTDGRVALGDWAFSSGSEANIVTSLAIQLQGMCLYHSSCTNDTLMGTVGSTTPCAISPSAFETTNDSKTVGSWRRGKNKGERSAQWWEPQPVVERERAAQCVIAVTMWQIAPNLQIYYGIEKAVRKSRSKKPFLSRSVLFTLCPLFLSHWDRLTTSLQNLDGASSKPLSTDE